MPNVFELLFGNRNKIKLLKFIAYDMGRRQYSINTIARRTNLSEATVSRHIKDLFDAGFVARHGNVYKVCITNSTMGVLRKTLEKW